MRVAIVGARHHPDLRIVEAYVCDLPEGDVVITGGAGGVDNAAEIACRSSGRCVHVWTPYGITWRVMSRTVDTMHVVSLGPPGAYAPRDALFLRNTFVAWECERMVIFPDGSRGGCWDGAREARRFRRPVEVRWADGRVQDYTGARSERQGA